MTCTVDLYPDEGDGDDKLLRVGVSATREESTGWRSDNGSNERDDWTSVGTVRTLMTRTSTDARTATYLFCRSKRKFDSHWKGHNGMVGFKGCKSNLRRCKDKRVGHHVRRVKQDALVHDISVVKIRGIEWTSRYQLHVWSCFYSSCKSDGGCERGVERRCQMAR